MATLEKAKKLFATFSLLGLLIAQPGMTSITRTFAPEATACGGGGCGEGTLTCPNGSSKVIIYSDTNTLLGNGAPSVPTWTGNELWHANIRGATWVWSSYYVTQPVAGESNTFRRTFDVPGPVTASQLTIAVDNDLIMNVNGERLNSVEVPNTFLGEISASPAGNLVQGTNTLEFEVTNYPQENGSVETNPAGLLYRMEVCYQTQAAPQCSDGIDNDGDHLIDYPNDPGCTSPQDTDEQNPGATECSDGVDNDGDQKIDALVEGSIGGGDFAIENAEPKYGKTWIATITCRASDGSTHMIGNTNALSVPAAVADAIAQRHLPFTPPTQPLVRTDNGSGDGSTWYDGTPHLPTLEAVCEILGYDSYVSSTCRDNERSGKYPNGKCNFDTPYNNEHFRFNGNISLPDCSDGSDNDNDGLIDMQDSGCVSPNDMSEVTHDPECDNPQDDSEEGPQYCADGSTLTLDEFIAAKNQGAITTTVTADQVANTVTATVTNRTGCTAPMSFSAYKMFDTTHLSTQVYYSGTPVRNISASETFVIAIPDCKVQADLWYGEAPQSLLDSDPYSQQPGYVPHFIDGIIPNDPLCTPQYCANGTSMTVDEFLAARSAGAVTEHLEVVNGTSVVAHITNNTNCTAPLSLSSYKMVNDFPYISTQILFDDTPTTTIAANGNTEFSVDL
ncbi:MAG: hypothetical protein PHI23_03760, partial [Candidatus Peribacteraceae bacterium]|nr:hypothetical protein [Candidatus Peribacteraceae bacterium]